MPDIITQLLAVLPKDVVFPPDRLALLDTGIFPTNLNGAVGVAPRSTREVACVMDFCAKSKTPLIPQGGRTGLTEAATATGAEVLLFSQNLTQHCAIDPISQTLTVSAGITLARAEEAARAQGLSLGIDLAARDSATIGGMIATNAGGMEAFRNGVMRQRVLGLEAVLPDGSILSDLSCVRKCNEGYDIKQLLIGSEGTLGVVTQAVLHLVPAPPVGQTILLACASIQGALALLQAVKSNANLTLLRAEAMWNAFAAANSGFHNSRALIEPADAPLYVILELHAALGTVADHFAQTAEPLMVNETILNAIIAQNTRQSDAIWLLREDTQTLGTKMPNGLWFDVTLPMDALATYMDTLQADLAQICPDLRLYALGHLGDGNLHLTVAQDAPFAPDQTSRIKAAVMARIKPLGGSFSAEHGIGREKRAALAAYGDPVKRVVMEQIKAALDPHNICNPGVVL